MIHTTLSQVKHSKAQSKLVIKSGIENITSIENPGQRTGNIENIESIETPGQKTGNTNNIECTNSLGQRTGQQPLYNLKNQSQETGNNTSI